MYTAIRYGLLLGYLAHGALATAIAELEERAPRCPYPYVNQQLQACPTATQFCSKFQRTFPPVATSTSVSTQVSTFSTVTTVIAGTAATVTQDYPGPTGQNCHPVSKREAAFEAQAAQPTAFGPSCNVRGIEPSKVDIGCSCLPGFSYTGKRPRPTTTVTVTSTSLSTTTTVSTSSVPPPAATLARFYIEAYYLNGTASDPMRVQTTVSGELHYFIATTFDNNRRGAVRFSLNPSNDTLRFPRLDDSYTYFGLVDARQSKRLVQVHAFIDQERETLQPFFCRMDASCGLLTCRYQDGDPMAFFLCPYKDPNGFNNDQLTVNAGNSANPADYVDYPDGCEYVDLYAAAPDS